MNLSSYDIALARKVNLPDYLIGQGFSLQHEGSDNFRVKGFQGLIVKENYWYRHATSEYGNSIDFVMKFENLKFYDAVRRLIPTDSLYQKVHWQFLKNTELVENYLIDTRNIDAEITRQLITAQMIKQDKANCACFLGYDEIGCLSYIFRRSINSEKPFKGEVVNSKKENSFQIILKNRMIVNENGLKISNLYIVEGAIDACAIATLLKIKKEPLDTIQIITTAGNPHNDLKNRIEKTKPNKITIATDMDQPGRKYAEKIKTMTSNIPTTIPTYNAKDPADLLQKIIRR